MPNVTFCAWTDVEDRLSADGATLRIDDNPDRARASVLRRAAQYVLGYAGLNYSTAALAASAWVRETTADVAWYFACTRRNNPASKAAAEAFERATELLRQIAALTFRIPDAAMAKGFAPVLSNQRVRQYPVSQVRTVDGKSTGDAENYVQHSDTHDQIDYGL